MGCDPGGQKEKWHTDDDHPANIRQKRSGGKGESGFYVIFLIFSHNHSNFHFLYKIRVPTTKIITYSCFQGNEQNLAMLKMYISQTGKSEKFKKYGKNRLRW